MSRMKRVMRGLDPRIHAAFSLALCRPTLYPRRMAPPLLILQDIGLTLGSSPLLDGASFSVSERDRLCLVGRNGSGKSTLLKIAAGLLEQDKGTRFFQPGATIRYLPQEPDLSGFKTVLDYVEAGLIDPDDSYGARYLLEQLGLTGDEDPTQLSGGEARRAALARTLAPKPDILLLDEPTNHLDLPAIEWLEEELKSLRSAMVIISHDRRFLSNLSRSTVWIDRGVTRRLDRGFAEFEAWRDKVLEEEEIAAHKLERRIVNEEHWVRYGVTARRKRNVGRMERLSQLRQEVRDQRRATGAVSLAASDSKTSGKLVVEAEGISKTYGDRAIVKNFSTRILRGDRIGIVGPNGAGKTTLLKMLIGQLEPDTGFARLGTNLELATLDQSRASLRPEWTLKEALTDGSGDSLVVNGVSRHVMSYMKDFLFQPEQARTPVGVLSGGERARLTLARALAKPTNFMVLDEPTNDLDIETLDLLEEMLADHPGTVIVVSHDRDFLDRVATSIIVAEGDGVWQEYAGGYSDMVAQRGAGVSGLAKVPVNLAAPRFVEPARDIKPAATAQKRKLSFKEKHALETLPAQMEAVQERLAKLRAILDDAGLYSRDPALFDKATHAAAKSESELAALEKQWLELEVLREELEG